jgi:hypothetical protein
MIILRVMRGLASYLPGRRPFQSVPPSAETIARYSYAVWLRHLVMAHRNGLLDRPAVVVELGPGNSLGTGIAAMLCGAERYVALDVVRCANAEIDRSVLGAIVALLEARAPIPDPSEFPKLEPFLPSYEFPTAILTGEILGQSLKESRLLAICDALLHAHEGAHNASITYHVGPSLPSLIQPGDADMILSQAVLEYVPDATATYLTLFQWLKPGGLISHAIDFRCHGTADEWNGHWTYSDFMWRIVAGKSAYNLNRLPHSVHIDLIRKAGFMIMCDQTTTRASMLDRSRLARRFQSLSPEDLTTSTTFVQGIRPK